MLAAADTVCEEAWSAEANADSWRVVCDNREWPIHCEGGNVYASADADYQAMKEKPEPPADLWDRVDAFLKEKPKQPENTRSTLDFMAKFKVSETEARRRIRALLAAGKIKQVGQIGTRRFYFPVDE